MPFFHRAEPLFSLGASMPNFPSGYISCFQYSSLSFPHMPQSPTSPVPICMIGEHGHKTGNKMAASPWLAIRFSLVGRQHSLTTYENMHTSTSTLFFPHRGNPTSSLFRRTLVQRRSPLAPSKCTVHVCCQTGGVL